MSQRQKPSTIVRSSRSCVFLITEYTFVTASLVCRRSCHHSPQQRDERKGKRETSRRLLEQGTAVFVEVGLAGGEVDVGLASFEVVLELELLELDGVLALEFLEGEVFLLGEDGVELGGCRDEGLVDRSVVEGGEGCSLGVGGDTTSGHDVFVPFVDVELAGGERGEGLYGRGAGGEVAPLAEISIGPKVKSFLELAGGVLDVADLLEVDLVAHGGLPLGGGLGERAPH
mmetsp:Transcript_608/g.1730  ORF Transcript_608/g.1730 Transcript_608/m.1730 type:complete len:229 (+) Transcript_608:1083-1769(+)